MHFEFLCIVYCNLFGDNSDTVERCFIILPSLGQFCSSSGGLSGRGFIQTGAFTDCWQVTYPIQLMLTLVVVVGTSKFQFFVPVASTAFIAWF